VRRRRPAMRLRGFSILFRKLIVIFSYLEKFF
jgi:hypothetical protein